MLSLPVLNLCLDGLGRKERNVLFGRVGSFYTLRKRRHIRDDTDRTIFHL